MFNMFRELELNPSFPMKSRATKYSARAVGTAKGAERFFIAHPTPSIPHHVQPWEFNTNCCAPVACLLLVTACYCNGDPYLKQCLADGQSTLKGSSCRCLRMFGMLFRIQDSWSSKSSDGQTCFCFLVTLGPLGRSWCRQLNDMVWPSKCRAVDFGSSSISHIVTLLLRGQLPRCGPRIFTLATWCRDLDNEGQSP